MDYKELRLTELLLTRQWLYTVGGGTSDHARKLADAQLDVDKELWQRLISGESPWDGRSRYCKEFTDDKFEETLKNIRDENAADTPEE